MLTWCSIGWWDPLFLNLNLWCNFYFFFFFWGDVTNLEWYKLSLREYYITVCSRGYRIRTWMEMQENQPQQIDRSSWPFIQVKVFSKIQQNARLVNVGMVPAHAWMIVSARGIHYQRGTLGGPRGLQILCACRRKFQLRIHCMCVMSLRGFGFSGPCWIPLAQLQLGLGSRFQLWWATSDKT